MDFIKQFDIAKARLNELLSSRRFYFDSLVPSDLPEDAASVYVIFNRITDEALYVGRTKKLRRRLYTNHLQGNKSTARLKKYIVEDMENFPQINSYDSAKQWIKENCYFQYIEVEESRKRGHIEGLIGFFLDSRYIEDEH